MTQILPLFEVHENHNQTCSSVRQINRLTAESWCSKYHYLNGAGSANWNYAVCASDGTCLSVIVLTMPANLHGIAKKYGLNPDTGNIEITRVATHPEAPKNTTSQAIRMALRKFQADSNLEWVFSYADTGQGHHGGIYQALNAIYLGATKEASGFTVNGQVVHSRTIGRHYGATSEQKFAELRANGIVIERVKGIKTPKHLYVIPIGSPASRRRIIKQLQPFSLPYPKR